MKPRTSAQGKWSRTVESRENEWDNNEWNAHRTSSLDFEFIAQTLTGMIWLICLLYMLTSGVGATALTARPMVMAVTACSMMMSRNNPVCTGRWMQGATISLGDILITNHYIASPNAEGFKPPIQ